MKRQPAAFTVEQVAARMDQGIAALDQARALQIARGLRFEHAKASVYAREHQRLRRKYGDGHPRTKEMAARVAGNTAYRAALVTQHAFASRPVPDAGKSWTVDGFVRTADGEPMPGVRVAAANREGQPYEEFDPAITDKTGYFRMTARTVPGRAARVYMRAFERDAPIESNENRLSPASGRTDRIEIVAARAAEPPRAAQPKAPATKSAATKPAATKTAAKKKAAKTKTKARRKTPPRK